MERLEQPIVETADPIEVGRHQRRRHASFGVFEENLAFVLVEMPLEATKTLRAMQLRKFGGWRVVTASRLTLEKRPFFWRSERIIPDLRHFGQAWDVDIVLQPALW